VKAKNVTLNSIYFRGHTGNFSFPVEPISLPTPLPQSVIGIILWALAFLVRYFQDEIPIIKENFYFVIMGIVIFADDPDRIAIVLTAGEDGVRVQHLVHKP
jgi:hypothetical protein